MTPTAGLPTMGFGVASIAAICWIGRDWAGTFGDGTVLVLKRN